MFAYRGKTALITGASSGIDGVANRWLFRFTDATPDGLSAHIIGSVMRPRHG